MNDGPNPLGPFFMRFYGPFFLMSMKRPPDALWAV